ncbi:MAG TPA: GNAT family N-acetyltransferase [Burkholderiaceae bacterium]|nr:GNAT family N-acetyltransferase [Burkholderiaceae bacterium]
MHHDNSAPLVPKSLVAQLGPHHRGRVLQHLRGLPARDLWLRFGYAVTDNALQLYVRKLHFSRDAVFGIFDDAAELLALGHLGFDKAAPSKTAEFGVSVLPHARRQGLGLRLLQRAAVHARNRGATRLLMTYMPDNTALKHLAQKAGMHLVPDIDEPRATLALDPATAASLMDETFSEMLAAIDLGFRVANADAAQRRLTSA